MPRPSRRRDAAPSSGFNRRLGWVLAACVATLLVVLWGLFAYSTVEQFRLARQAAISDTATLTKLVEAWAHSTLTRLSYLVANIDVELQEGHSTADLNVLLGRQKAADPNLFVVIEVRDPQDRLIATSDPTFPVESARNFDSDLAQTTPSYIGLPRSVGGRMLMPVLYPMLSPSGKGLGAIVAEIDPDYFAGFSANLGLPAGASVVLLRADGPLLAHNPPTLGTLGRSYRNAPLWDALSAADHGSFEATEIDGAERVVSYRTSSDFPLVVSIGFASDQVYAEAWRRAIYNGLIAAALSLIIIVATALLLFQLKRRAAAEASANIARAAVRSVGSGVAVVVLDDSRRMVLVNPAFGRLLDCDAGALEGRLLAEVTETQPLALFAACDWPTATSAETVRELQLEHADGRPLWVELRIAPIPDALGAVRHAVLVVTDVTERKRAEQDLVQAKEVAEASSRAKSDFLANMSHELRTPLNAVIGFAEVIAGQMLGPIGTDRYREYADNIQDAGIHLLEIISDILDLAKVEADRVVLEEGHVDVADLLAMCATLVAGRAAEAEVKVRIQAAPDLPLLLADELRVKQIVLNLLSNAVKFSLNGTEVTVTAGTGPDGGIEIAVRDRGCGMTEDELKLAVQPFRQVNGAIAKRNEGVGLGLPLAVRLTKLHGGKLLIDSTPGEGTTACAQFPAARTARQRSAA